MIQKISRATVFIFVSIAIIFMLILGPTSSDALVKGWTPADKGTLSPEANGDNPLGIVIQPTPDNENIELQDQLEDKKQSNYPDLGSEQVFPFEPGLGNSA